MKGRLLAILMTCVLSVGMLTGCGADKKDSAKATEKQGNTNGAEEGVDAPAGLFSDGDSTETENAKLDTSENLSGKHHAVIKIQGYGEITVELDADTAPITVTNFVKLAQDGFYNGLTFHRIMDGFMMQGGDPNANGTGGSDETIKGEFSNNGVENKLSHTKGAISMARSSDPNSASSQFFIVQTDSTFLDGNYAVFGYVTEGIEIVDEICKDAVPTDNNGSISKNKQPVMDTIEILD